MRVLMLAESYAPVVGGEERVVQDLSRELVARGHSVAVATLCRTAIAQPDGIRVHRLRNSAGRLPRAARDTERQHAMPAPDPETVRDLARVLALEQPDVIHAHNWLVHSYAPLHQRGSAPLVVSLHDYDLICATKRLFYRGQPCTGPGLLKCIGCAGNQYGRVTGATLALAMRVTVPYLRHKVDMFIAISNAVRRGCELRASEPIRVIPNFVAPLPRRPDPEDPRLALLPSEPYILFFGDASIDKGARHLGEVYRSLEAPPPLVFVGRCLVEELRSIPGVVVAGPLPHDLTIEAVRRSLFTVAPSLWAEPFGMVAIETAAAGKPIVASDIGGLRDIVVHGQTGLLVPAGDRWALREALERLIGDGGLRDRLGRAALTRARAFGSDVAVPQFEAVYGTVTAAGASARAAPAN